MKLLSLTAIAAVSLALQTAAYAGPAAPGGLTTPSRTTFKTPVNCSGVQRCNSIISYCAEKNGVWKETSHNTQGQPTAGRCTLPN